MQKKQICNIFYRLMLKDQLKYLSNRVNKLEENKGLINNYDVTVPTPGPEDNVFKVVA